MDKTAFLVEYKGLQKAASDLDYYTRTFQEANPNINPNSPEFQNLIDDYRNLSEDSGQAYDSYRNLDEQARVGRYRDRNIGAGIGAAVGTAGTLGGLELTRNNFRKYPASVRIGSGIAGALAGLLAGGTLGSHHFNHSNQELLRARREASNQMDQSGTRLLDFMDQHNIYPD